MQQLLSGHLVRELSLALLLLVGAAQAEVPMDLLTPNEQRRVLESVANGGASTGLSESQFLEEIESGILRANPGAESISLRTPVSKLALRILQGRLAMRGQFVPLEELQASTDYAQALMRESSTRPLSKLVEKLPFQQRNAFHGKVAEVAEARARGMVLTKSDRSPVWDLTESKSTPRNYQMKIYAQSDRALASLLDDLDQSLDFQKRGILTQETLDRETRAGRIRRVGRYYEPIGRPDVRLESSKMFGRPAESRLYAKAGGTGLMRLGKTRPLPGASGLRWLKPAGIAVLVVTEGYLVWGASTGRLTDRDFVVGQSAVAGGVAGGWAGAVSGAMLGGLLPPPLDAAGVPVGVVIGGIAGAIVGSEIAVTAATGIYGRLDDAQREEVAADIYKRYGLPP
jgi:hypothetical protein